MPEFRIEKVETGGFFPFFPSGRYEESHHLSVETEEFVVRKAPGGVVFEVFLRDYPAPYVLVRPFPLASVVVLGKSFSQAFQGRFPVEGGLVPAYHHSQSGVVVAFEDEALRKGVEIHIFRPVPDSQRGDNVFFPDYPGHIILDEVFIHHHAVFRTPVVELEPVEFLIEAARVPEVQGVVHGQFPLLLYEAAVADDVWEKLLPKH